MRKLKGNYDGFTLVEVLASIVIISIILLGVVQLMNFTNKTAITNNVKLVTTHLAKATIERMKIKSEDYFLPEQINGEPITKENCQITSCKNLYRLTINDESYDVIVIVSQNSEEVELQLINVIVTVKHSNKNIKSTVEGYVIDEV